MGDQDQRGAALAVHLEQQLDHVLAGGRVEVAGGLVGEQQPRLAHEGARHRDALLLAAGELARIVAEALAQADALEHRAGARRGIG
ncbi:MAG TPA: hypothetical protein VLC53_13550, partial [Myxococcota bacterium]|nr:hypothetical protein [Myxococcota bacterium]